MNEFVNKLNKIKKNLDYSTDSTTTRFSTVNLVEALIEGNQQVNKRIDTLEQKLEEHRRKGHKSRGF